MTEAASSVRSPCNLPEVVRLVEYGHTPDLPLGRMERSWLRAILSDTTRFRRIEVPSADDQEGMGFLGATHFVGLLPFRCVREEQHLVVILPKGAHPESSDEHDCDASLLRFSQILAITSGGDSAPDRKGPVKDDLETDPGWRAQGHPGDKFVLLVAWHFARLVRDLCLRDFRRFYRIEGDVLRGRIRGRLSTAALLRTSIRGRAHQLPCQWDEFTPDNWDNRILKRALRALEEQAGRLGAHAGRAHIRRLFRPAVPYFADVHDVEIAVADLERARLGRVSRRYRVAMGWASTILRGFHELGGGSGAPKLLIDSNKAFEQLARRVAQVACQKVDPDWTVPKKKPLDKSLLQGKDSDQQPDILVESARSHSFIAVGDAKYKQVLDLPDGLGNGAVTFDAVVRHRIAASDFYQLYAYMRLTQAPRGFFVVPHWDSRNESACLITNDRFTVSPLDNDPERTRHQIAVLGLNLLKIPSDAVAEGARLLSEWLRNSEKGRTA